MARGGARGDIDDRFAGGSVKLVVPVNVEHHRLRITRAHEVERFPDPCAYGEVTGHDEDVDVLRRERGDELRPSVRMELEVEIREVLDPHARTIA